MSERFQVYSLNPDEIVDSLGATDRLTPKLFPQGGGMKRFVTHPGLEFRAGHTKLNPGQGFKTFFWYDEFWVVRRGRGRLVAVDRVTGEEESVELGDSDTVFFGKGIHARAEAIGDEPWVFFYIAIPASKKEAPWLAKMTEEDLEDVRLREEYSQ